MSEPIIQLLTLCLIALVYLFFLRVLRAVWVEVRPTRTREREPRTARGRRRQQRILTQLVTLEPASQAGWSHPVGDEITLGRAAGCAIVVDDTYVSQLHARVFRRDGQLLVEDLGSTNGTYLNRQRVTAPAVLRRGDRLQVGATIFEVR
jgi:hypothetical protein